MNVRNSGDSGEMQALRAKVEMHDRILRGGEDGRGGIVAALERNTEALDDVRRVIRQADEDRKTADRERRNDRRMVLGSFISAGLAAVAAAAAWAWKHLPHQP